jgi:hypothetical protein
MIRIRINKNQDPDPHQDSHHSNKSDPDLHQKICGSAALPATEDNILHITAFAKN